MWFGVDVCDSASVNSIAEKAQEGFGETPDLIYCAGIVKDTPLALTSDESWKSVIDTNLTGAFYFIRALSRPLMVTGDGRIILIGSVSAKRGNPGQGSYSAAKSGLESLCRVTAVEFGRFGATCNVISPGAIESRMVRDTPRAAVDKLLKATPLRQFGRPADVAAAVDYLLGPGGRYVTGQTLMVDGGLSAV